MDGSQVMHYVAWEVLCRPKNCGGSGIQSALARIGLLREKFAWNLLEESNSLLNRNFLAKYGDRWWNKEEFKGGSPSWKIITSGWKALKKFVRWKVVDGSNINVLKDAWILDKSLLKWPTFVGIFDDENLALNFFIED
ncbi:hypothetical protein KFK09_026446 [Dendrobium nobile]|uniref:Uncharacterized protein n=1 Tax=Dendrobium nobile TaxID=94219 RepID=A0A8T3A7J2_DENNO|nr:hypothetical protein KFK09_026446 [Dendrobium nobile]